MITQVRTSFNNLVSSVKRQVALNTYETRNKMTFSQRIRFRESLTYGNARMFYR